MNPISLNIELNKLINYDYLNNLEWYELDIKKLPEHSGCYMLIVDGEIKYVGKSSNLRKRMNDHINKKGVKGIKVKYTLEDNPVAVAVLEMVLVSKYLPEWNHEVKQLEKI